MDDEIGQAAEAAYRAAHPSEGLSINKQLADQLTPRDAWIEGYRAGVDSVGLGDFLPNPCGEEHSIFLGPHHGSEWVRCTLRRGHDEEHEDENSGAHWPRVDD